jgi:hypothetical protein
MKGRVPHPATPFEISGRVIEDFRWVATIHRAVM